MKLLRLIAAMCMLFFFFSACKKDSTSPSSPAQKRLTRYTETLNPGTVYSTTTSYNFAYDENNKLVSITNTKDPGSKFMFSHVQDGFSFDIYGSGNVVIHKNVFMSNGMMDSTNQHNNEGDTTSEKYIYWGGGRLKYLMSYGGPHSTQQLTNVTEYTYGVNGEVTTEQDYRSTTVYAYNKTEVSNFNLYPIYINRSKYLPSTLTYSNGTVVVTTNHTYTFDDEKRLIKDLVSVSTGDTIEKAFLYE